MRTIDKSAEPLLMKAAEEKIELAWDRFEKQQPQCGFGLTGLCCRNCNMGPCKIDPFGNGPQKGVCGANADTIVARSLARMIAAGAAAHSDHGRDITHVLHLAAEGKAKGYGVKSDEKLRKIATEYGIDLNGSSLEIAGRLAQAVMEEFGMVKGRLQFIDRAPLQRRENWEWLGVLPRGVDREIVETMHRTHIGVDTDYSNLILHGLRTSLSDGWGGSMIATELSDILFGVPELIKSKVNLGVLKENEVNVVVHGHEPLMSETVLDASRDPELIQLAKNMGAEGINLCGMCCTANELLMRKGIPVAGNFLNQELALVTGAVEAMVVDVQCIMPSLVDVAQCYHTLLISTSPKAKFPGAIHIEFDEERALDISKQIIRMAVENYARRKRELVRIPDGPMDMVAGFSVEAILDLLGGTLNPLIDEIKAGNIKGVAAIVGCNNPKITHDKGHVELTKRLIENDILTVQTGCAAIANAKAGLLVPEAAEYAGEGLKKVCKSLGIPPVLHMGSCVDISRILVFYGALADTFGVDIAELPIAGAAPEWMSEKAVSIGAYMVASGIFTVLGTIPQVMGSTNMVRLLTDTASKVIGGKFAFETDPIKGADLMVTHIEDKRGALGI